MIYHSPKNLTGEKQTRKIKEMKNVILVVALITCALLSILLVIAIRQNHDMQFEIEALSDEILELRTVAGEFD